MSSIPTDVQQKNVAFEFDEPPPPKVLAMVKRSPLEKPRRPVFVIPVAYLFAIMTTLAVIMGWQNYQLLQHWHKPNNYFSLEAGNQLIDWYVWGLVALLAWQFMRWFSLQGPKWKRDIAVHLGIAIVVAPIATLLYILVLGVSGLGKLSGVSLQYRLVLNLYQEWIPNVIEYLTIVAILASVEYYRCYRADQLEKVQLQRALTESKLQTLRQQLNPHFLFNAMNSVSCLLHNDPAAADQVLSRVANLLRLTLARGDDREVRLLEEIELAEEYLEIQKIRFGPRLKVEIETSDEVLDAMVPNMLLQPLVENACVHGVNRVRGECCIEIKAGMQAGMLVISIYNDGPPVRSDWKSNSGIGLRNTIERLALLYGHESNLELANFRQGALLLLTLPLYPAPSGNKPTATSARLPVLGGT